MTEAEAKTKWCPFVRFSDRDGFMFNRGDIDPMNDVEHGESFVPRCIGSACMAWRRKAYTEGTTSYDAAYGDKTLGYCGLAGKL